MSRIVRLDPTGRAHVLAEVQRRRRGTYVVTDEDRAILDRVALRVPIPVPVLTPEEVRAHILATHRRGGEQGSE